MDIGKQGLKQLDAAPVTVHDGEEGDQRRGGHQGGDQPLLEVVEEFHDSDSG
ncbi:hypothetical protein D3C71_2080000 [compost metagenome]